MMPPKADTTVSEVPSPLMRWCRSGHRAPELFRLDGREPTPTRFFRVESDKDVSVEGIYCEPCLILAGYLARKQGVQHGSG